jgi:hypothetical protein
MALIPGTLPNGTKYPNDPQSLLDTFASYLTAPEAKKNRPTVSVVTPTGGGTITFNSSGQDETIFLDHDPAITGLTVVFPTNSTSAVGQTIRVFPRTAVNATVSYTLGGQTVRGTNPTSYSATTNYEWQKVANNTWIRIQ